ncbi:uncharacterized protein LOC134226495 [Armigeres subalbatus]|uniref:uncharacterized protein LOC134226495 n=1 Tax=Armigeres subalbatus TaxID=124917 RepID=UPI002ED2B945
MRRTGLLGGGAGAARLWASCWCLSLALLSFSALATAQFSDEDDGFDLDDTKTMRANLDGAETEGNGDNHNNSSMRCWSCVAKHRSWSDCQNMDEIQYCENPDATTCMKSSIRIEGLLGRETRYHRLAGCGQNETALREAYFEFFEITFGESDRVTLEEFTTCEGPLCNVMDEAALLRGKWRVVHGNVLMGAGGRAAGSAVTLLMGVVLAIGSRM